jgi:hypothetical protein
MTPGLLSRTALGLGLFCGPLFGLSLLGGCGSPPPPADYAAVQTIMIRACTFSSCHSQSGSPAGGLVLQGDVAYCNLIGATKGATVLATAKAMYPLRVTAGNRQTSFLYKKLTMSPSESGTTKPLGTSMPQGSPLEPVETDVFGSWIDSGAPNAAGVPAPGGCQ